MAVLAGALAFHAHRFDWDLPLGKLPSLPLAAGLVTAGLAFLVLKPLVAWSLRATPRTQRTCLWLVVGIGLVLRLMMFATVPALEDDQQRYLFEGAMVANGISPYRVSPGEAAHAAPGTALSELAVRSWPIVERVNHAMLKTIYPPVAQGAFALAYLVEPFSLQAWRGILLAADAGVLVLLLWLLRATGRPLLWVALYWWNPLAIKELFNSGHMEGVLMLFVVLAVYLAGRRRFVSSAAVLGLAVGVKVWPVLLAPLLLRPLTTRPWRGALAVALLAGLCVAWAVPIVLGGLDARSGFLAYAEQWQANSALLPGLRDLIQVGLDAGGHGDWPAGRLARGLLALSAAGIALAASVRPVADVADLLRRVALVTLALVLLSPAQFPWYTLWTLPFLPFAPRWSVIAMAVTLPLYYVSFHYAAIGSYPVFRDRVVWLIWLPIWLLLATEAVTHWRRRAANRT
ncbi:MAG: glycosyltransferase 87 family protein [Hyphomicrobiaceae bacterium]